MFEPSAHGTRKDEGPAGMLLPALVSPILFKGDEKTAYRDPAVVYHQDVFYLFYTLVQTDSDDRAYLQVATSTSVDLGTWTRPRILTSRDANLNYSSPGNVVRVGDEWVMCLQTYPRPNGEKYGNADCRLWLMRSRDLIAWSSPELLRVKGPDVPREKMGRMIDPYLVQDREDAGKWWCFYKQDGVSMSWSKDLRYWTYFGRANSGENVCVIVQDDQYVLFHSPENGIGVKRSRDLRHWTDGGVITLGQKDWPWARGRLTAGFVLDLRDEPRVAKYLMFFHGTGPEDERTMFDTHASLGLAWSDDLVTWKWGGDTVASGEAL